MNIYKRLAVATAGIVLSLATVEATNLGSVQAAIVENNFTVDVTSGMLAGDKFDGNFSYDNSFLTGIGSESLGVPEGLSINFNFLGKTYTAQDSISGGYTPQASFNGGNLQGLLYPVGDVNTGFFIGNLQLFIGGTDFYLGSNVGGSGNIAPVGTVTYFPSSVPEPSEVSGTLLLTLGFRFLLRKKLAPS